MLFQRFGTIKTQLYTITALVILSLFLFAFSEWKTLQRISSLQTLSMQVSEVNVDMLLLRRHEKDFLARLDMQYVEKFQSRAQIIDDRVMSISDIASSFDPSLEAQIITMAKQIQTYVQRFGDLTQSASLIGLSEREGLRGEVFESGNAAEEAFLIQGDDLLYSQFLTLRRNESDFKLTKQLEHQTYYNNNIDNLISSIQNSPLPSSTSSEFTALLHAFQSDFTQLVEAYNRIGLKHTEGQLGQLRALIQQVEQDVNTLEQQLISISDKLQSDELRFLFTTIALLSLVIIGLLVTFGHQLTQRLSTVNQMMNDIAKGEGDLTYRMDVKGKDELAMLACDINEFIARLQGMIQQIGGISEQLHTAAQGSFHATEASRANAEQQQVDSTDAATAVSEMLVTNMSITDHTQQAAENAHIVRSEAQQSLEILSQAGGDISQLAHYLHDSQQTIKQLESQSEAISAVVAVIQSIAEQTNLLALNAAIEAARAGESGRGFAVVADEVRQLATRTHDSTQEIENTIKGLSGGVQDSVNTILNGKQQADQSAEKAQLAIDSMQTIVNTIEALVEMNNAIAQGSTEQSQSSDDINQRIMHISDLAMSTMDVIQHASERSEEVESMSQELQAIVGRFKY